MTANMKSGLSTITGIAVLGRPQLITKKSVQLDCQLYLEGSSILLGCVRFYNDQELLFDRPGLYLIESTFARVPLHNSSLALPKGDYDFVGDLQWVHRFSDVDLDSEDTVLPAFPPYVHASGLATNCNRTNASFTLDIDVWVSSLLKVEPGTTPPPKPVAAYLCSIPDSPKYKYGNKPTPYEKRFVAVHGFITGKTTANDGAVERFKLNVDQVDFLGSLDVAGGGSTVINTLDALSATPRTKGFGRVKYGQGASPNTPNKRPRIDTESPTGTSNPPAQGTKAGLSSRQLEKSRAD